VNWQSTQKDSYRSKGQARSRRRMSDFVGRAGTR
jgi:hypothetical protein